MKTANERIKKTFYIDPEIARQIRIKSAVEDNSDTITVNKILTDYFSEKENKYSFSQKENKS